MSDNKILLEVNDLKKYYPIETGFFRRVTGNVRAVDGVSFAVRRGEAFGLVGESGCGKTTLGRCLVRLITPTSGSVLLHPEGGGSEGLELTTMEKRELRVVRRQIQMVFQDPYSSLDPRMTVLDTVGEPLLRSRIAKGKALQERVKDLIARVGLDPRHINRYPHAFSGGQRQRIGIARALATNPKFIVADEPVSALDVSIQAQVLNLLQDLQTEFGLTYLFIAHDLSVVEHISDRVGVMYVGKLVELADTEELYLRPRHPYTEALLEALPKPDPDLREEKRELPGEVANPADPPSGCYFHPRCFYAQDRCRTESPRFEEITDGHFVSCHRAQELDLRGVPEL